jgi:(1->4)-alpha-D-glucan 1-alpha-D-glucosylmutase
VAPEHVCTYRLQLTPDFGFDEAAAIAGYLARLGVSHVYLSPIARAAPGSTHGYDVCDPTTLSSDLGGPQAYERLCDALATAGLGQILDIVPNHMAVALSQNRWLDDVLRNGPDSPYAAYFDLSWNEFQAEIPYVELPFLGADYATALANGEIRLVTAEDGPRVAYGDLALPLRPGTEPSTTALTSEELDTLLGRQHYRLVDWRTANQRLSYRRFFDVASLIGLRAEDEATVGATHALPLELIRTGRADGLRIDHVDGLRDPDGYLRRLRTRAPQARIVVEKILGPQETLPDWPVDGTTGYDFLNRLNGLFVDPAGEQALSSLYAEFTGLDTGYDAVLDESKRKVIQRLFGAELSQLTQLLGAVAGAQWHPEDCEAVLTEALVAFSVYRTYLQPGTQPSPEDVEVLEGATKRAAAKIDPRLQPLLETLREVLLLRREDEAASELALRFQQLSGPVMAKGAEDTAFYAYNRLVSLNEVGGDPSRFSVSVNEFHAFCAETARRWPRTMLATATHDTKRGEDIRLRIDALSRIPEEWVAAVHRWAALNEAFRSNGLPDRNTAYLFYQTLIGAWPLSLERVWAYMLKAVHEAKIHTSWRQQDAAYETALQRFVAGALANDAFIADLEAFVIRVIELATPAVLAQTLLKLTAPGIPDIYQGCELLDLNLVDPDNRRPVDYALRREKLEAAERFETAADVMRQRDPGLTKLWLTQRVLQTRHRHLDAFRGDYVPLHADDDSLVAFVRGGEVIAVAQIRGERGETLLTLPEGAWRNVLTGESLSGGDTPVANLLADLNVALLVREPST